MSDQRYGPGPYQGDPSHTGWVCDGCGMRWSYSDGERRLNEPSVRTVEEIRAVLRKEVTGAQEAHEAEIGFSEGDRDMCHGVVGSILEELGITLEEL